MNHDLTAPYKKLPLIEIFGTAGIGAIKNKYVKLVNGKRYTIDLLRPDENVLGVDNSWKAETELLEPKMQSTPPLQAARVLIQKRYKPSGYYSITTLFTIHLNIPKKNRQLLKKHLIYHDCNFPHLRMRRPVSP